MGFQNSEARTKSSEFWAPLPTHTAYCIPVALGLADVCRPTCVHFCNSRKIISESLLYKPAIMADFKQQCGCGNGTSLALPASTHKESDVVLLELSL